MVDQVEYSLLDADVCLRSVYHGIDSTQVVLDIDTHLHLINANHGPCVLIILLAARVLLVRDWSGHVAELGLDVRCCDNWNVKQSSDLRHALAIVED